MVGKGDQTGTGTEEQAAGDGDQPPEEGLTSPGGRPAGGDDCCQSPRCCRARSRDIRCPLSSPSSCLQPSPGDVAQSQPSLHPPHPGAAAEPAGATGTELSPSPPALPPSLAPAPARGRGQSPPSSCSAAAGEITRPSEEASSEHQTQEAAAQPARCSFASRSAAQAAERAAPEGNPSMLWSGYLVGCRGHSKQERALSSSRGSSRSFSVQAGAICTAVEPENVRQPHVLLEIHSGGEGGELDPCAGFTARTATREKTSPCTHTHTPRHQPFPASKRGLEPQHTASAALGAAALGIKGSILHCQGSCHPEPRVPKVPSLVASPPW